MRYIIAYETVNWTIYSAVISENDYHKASHWLNMVTATNHARISAITFAF